MVEVPAGMLKDGSKDLGVRPGEIGNTQGSVVLKGCVRRLEANFVQVTQPIVSVVRQG